MVISWNEIKDRAVTFSKEWENARREEAESQEFLIEFFKVFGVTKRKVATFEQKVKKLDEHEGYIDLLWKKMILVEMKSRGKDLDKAYKQARDYIDGLPQHELPKYILISDFEHFHLYDLDSKENHEFQLEDLVDNVHIFSELAGYSPPKDFEKNEADIQATEKMAQIHDYLSEAGYTGHKLEVFLVRLVFCMFADDSVLFNKNIFTDFILNNTREDGSDLGARLIELFNNLNTPAASRMNNLDESLAVFPYVNGKLFEEQLQIPSFNTKMRTLLLESCELNWSSVSPAIFGSMFQNVIDQKLRRSLGAHFTSEKNILRLIKPLFLDKLWAKFEAIKNSNSKLKAFHDEIAELRFFDPACGCGNFLVVTYREMRKLEIEILKILYKGKTQLDIKNIIKLDVDSYSGIEIEEFPAKVAELALWLTDHQMNVVAHKEFGQFFVRLPLKKKANIINGNALRIDWGSLSEKPFDYILGNPPFGGKHLQSHSQKEDMALIFDGVKGAGVLDYVTAWYIKAAQYLEKYNSDEISDEKKTCVAFVSTNSISQGEQVGILWNELFNRYKSKIHFAYRTFKWDNEAKGKAAVHVVIIGFSNFDINSKRLFEYEDIKGEPHETKAKNINPYLVEANDHFILSRRKPICDVPKILFGCKATDGGNLILSEKEKDSLVEEYPQTKKYIRRYVGSDDLINDRKRYCLWLVDANPSEIKQIPEIKDRIQKVAESRMASKKEATRKKANIPSIFAEIRETKTDFLAIPLVSSENRNYIPIRFFDKTVVGNQNLQMIGNAGIYHFGILTSQMHMVWTEYTCGRLESRYSYSNTIVYNNYPWPENPTDKQKQAIEKAAQSVLDAREKFPDASLADLYDPLTMPAELVKAHRALDKAVDRAYRPQPFPNEAKRMEFLFDLYDKYTITLVAEKRGKKKKTNTKTTTQTARIEDIAGGDI